MYIPKDFEEKDINKLLQFMKEYNFGVLINNLNGKPIAAHLPFIIGGSGNNVILKSHMAKANPQWKSFNGKDEVLVIFSEPHSYISPSLYNHERNVPTWNYIAVHAYGIPQIITNENEIESLFDLTFDTFEKSYKAQWNNLDIEYKNKLLEGITAFKINVNKIEGKFKLSQNKTSEERKRIINSLESSKDSIKIDLSKHMKKYG
jgi:transcriptional regulator